MIEPLSPSSEAVLEACGCGDPDSQFRLVARGFAGTAIRAVADRVTPASMPEGPDCCLSTVEMIRAELLSIAAELEGVIL